MKTWWIAALLFAVVLCSGIYTIRQWSACTDAGGEYVRAMSGFYKCVDGKEIK